MVAGWSRTPGTSSLDQHYDAQAIPCEWEYRVPTVTIPDDWRATDVDVHSTQGAYFGNDCLHAFQARRPVPFRYCRANPCPSRRHWPSRYIHQVGVRHESKLEVYNSEWCRLRVGRNLGRIA